MRVSRLAAAATVGVLTVASLAAAAGVERQHQRKIAVVEKIFDTTLIESRFALVSTGDNTHGVVLDGQGAFFTLEFSFVEEPHRKFLEKLDDLDDLVKNWRELLELDEEGRAAMREKRRELFESVKSELTETLLDYGSTLSFLGNGDWVTLAAFPWGREWDVSPEPVRSLLIRIRFKDLRRFAEGSIDEEQAVSLLDITEMTD